MTTGWSWPGSGVDVTVRVLVQEQGVPGGQVAHNAADSAVGLA